MHRRVLLRRVSCLLIGLLLLCLNGLGQARTSGSSKSENPEDFEAFYSKFYADSTFQVSRVLFPLKGYNQKATDLAVDAAAGNAVFYTTLDKWRFQPRPPQEGEKHDEVARFRFELTKKEDWVGERVWSEDTPFLIEKHFKRIDNRWWLVYFFYNDS